MSQPPRRPRHARRLGSLAAVAVAAGGCGLVGWDWDTKMTTVIPKSDFGQITHDVFMLISWISVVIFLAVEGGLLYACWRFRDRPGRPRPAQTHGHTPLEIGWTIAFAVVLLIIGIPTVRVIFATQEAPAATALRVDVAGRQWWWEFRYPDLKITTANEAHIPVGQTVAFHLHAPDVIHSFWVPQLGGKRDVVPGRVNRLVMTPRVPGEYVGQCAEYCGTSHANMRFRVIVHAKEEWDRWVAAQQAPPVEPADPLAQQGKEIFTQTACVGCHTVRGLSGGVMGPDLTHFGSRKTFAGGLYPTTREHLARWVQTPDDLKPGALMPRLGLSREQSEAVAAYLLSLK
jgi:cytochrome c oxidase subunit 2